jgi:hypothetical protein
MQNEDEVANNSFLSFANLFDSRIYKFVDQTFTLSRKIGIDCQECIMYLIAFDESGLLTFIIAFSFFSLSLIIWRSAGGK